MSENSKPEKPQFLPAHVLADIKQRVNRNKLRVAAKQEMSRLRVDVTKLKKND